ncbi:MULTISPECIES: hypothetical protein [Geobacillus]|uniref:hypothetical protein n=1 Tax=Geobacillus TaxID=129337 RepID=UPI0009DEEF16|nr:hypothetical protein [Geobacillus genomosp. 3]
MNIYLADFVVRERNEAKKGENMYRIFIKEMKHPFSIRLKTIVPTNFTDSLRCLRSKGEKGNFSFEGETLFRTVACSDEAQLYLVFKCVSQLYMFIVKLDLRLKTLAVALYEWNQLQQKYMLIRTNEWLSMEKQLIYEILQSIYICDHRRISYLFPYSARNNREK